MNWSRDTRSLFLLVSGVIVLVLGGAFVLLVADRPESVELSSVTRADPVNAEGVAPQLDALLAQPLEPLANTPEEEQREPVAPSVSNVLDSDPAAVSGATWFRVLPDQDLGGRSALSLLEEYWGDQWLTMNEKLDAATRGYLESFVCEPGQRVGAPGELIENLAPYILASLESRGAKGLQSLTRTLPFEGGFPPRADLNDNTRGLYEELHVALVSLASRELRTVSLSNPPRMGQIDVSLLSVFVSEHAGGGRWVLSVPASPRSTVKCSYRAIWTFDLRDDPDCLAIIRAIEGLERGQ